MVKGQKSNFIYIFYQGIQKNSTHLQKLSKLTGSFLLEVSYVGMQLL